MKIEIKNEWFKKKYEPKFKKLPKKICEEEKKICRFAKRISHV